MIPLIFKDKEHSKFSPSSSSRWLSCHASILKEKDYPSEYRKSTLIGMFLHDLLAECLKRKDINIIVNKIGTKYYLREVGKYFTFTENYFKSIYSFYEYFISKIKNPDNYEFYTEEKVNFDKYMVDGYGYVDCYLIQRNMNDDKYQLDVFDYKTGYVTVYNAYKNTQLMIYALGILEKHSDKEFDSINLHIIQPSRKINHSWNPSKEDLEELGIKMRNIYELVMNGKAETNGGESQCQYCKAREECVDAY